MEWEKLEYAGGPGKVCTTRSPEEAQNKGGFGPLERLMGKLGREYHGADKDGPADGRKYISILEGQLRSGRKFENGNFQGGLGLSRGGARGGRADQ